MTSIVFCFGRMNPPTKGHELLVSKVVETAKQIGGDHIVYLSFTQNDSTDPLDWNFKKRVCEAAFRGVNISADPNIRNPYLALEHLKDHYNRIIMVAGSDQQNEYIKRFTKYTEEWGVNFLVLTAGQRLDEGAGVESISATKMRKYASENNKSDFYSGLPSMLNKRVKQLVFTNTQKALKTR
jgi:nicotinic acid mononucleotide adenylyltransferase